MKGVAEGLIYLHDENIIHVGLSCVSRESHCYQSAYKHFSHKKDDISITIDGTPQIRTIGTDLWTLSHQEVEDNENVRWRAPEALIRDISSSYVNLMAPRTRSSRTSPNSIRVVNDVWINGNWMKRLNHYT